MTVEWNGVLPALMTEFKGDKSLDLESTARHIEACIEAGVDGLVMLGSLGENSSLRPEEKEAVLRAAVEAIDGRIPVLAGAAEHTTDLALVSAPELILTTTPAA